MHGATIKIKIAKNLFEVEIYLLAVFNLSVFNDSLIIQLVTWCLCFIAGQIFSESVN
jgi:hypothetical protein